MIKKIFDIPTPHDCKNCVPCIKLRLLEMGFEVGADIEILSDGYDLKRINILTEKGNITSTIALRNNEFERLCLV